MWPLHSILYTSHVQNNRHNPLCALLDNRPLRQECRYVKIRRFP